MDRNLETAFGMEVRFQAVCAEKAFEAIEQCLARRRELTQEIARLEPYVEHGLTAERDALLARSQDMVNETGLTLLHLQAFLSAAGVLSSVFWPSLVHATAAERKARVERSACLRGRFEVGDESPLHIRTGKSGDARGGLLHVDEMLEDYAARHRSDALTILDVGRSESRDGWDPDGALRTLDEVTMVLRVNGRSCDLLKLRDEIRRVGSKIALTGNLSWKTFPGMGRGSDGSFLEFRTGRSPRRK